MADRPEFDVDHILADALFEEYESWDKDMKIWPSDLGVALGPKLDGCPVEFYYKCRDAPRNHPSPGEILMFKMGDLVEECLVGLLIDHAPRHGWRVVGTQGRHKFAGISGRSDVILEHIESGYRIVVDIKSKRGNAFKYLKEPKPGNVLQVQHYVAADDADEGYLVYADREGQNFVRSFSVPREDHRPITAVSVLKGIRDNEEPPEPVGLTVSRRENKGSDAVYLKTPWQMDWCSLKECRCKAALPKAPPSGIVARISNDGVVTATDGNEVWLPVVTRLLKEEYPDEDFLVDGELFDG